VENGAGVGFEDVVNSAWLRYRGAPVADGQAFDRDWQAESNSSIDQAIMRRMDGFIDVLQKSSLSFALFEI
jgi:hypothetical protein